MDLVRTRTKTSIVLRFSGSHPTDLQVIDGKIVASIPGARITLAAKAAALSFAEAWTIAHQELDTAFDRGISAGYLDTFETLSEVRLTFVDRVPDLRVETRAPSHSPSGYGQLTVQIGSLTIICDDLAAAAEQLVLWADAAELAPEVWPSRIQGPDLEDGFNPPF